ncbi:Valacyclovir hydrolase [Halotydeus destructor]|nr:Valacyclovir hydrolase [Halotydeus destructor]
MEGTLGPPGQFTEVNGYRIHYEHVGSGPKVVLLLHGGMGSTRTDYSVLLDTMDRAKYTLVAWDAPGYGYSRPYERQFHLGAQLHQFDADLAAALMSQLGFHSYSVMGWSAGARTAVMLAAAHPVQVVKLVIWGVSARMTTKHKQFMADFVDVSNWSTAKAQKFQNVYGNDLQELWSRHVQYTLELNDVCTDHLKHIRCPTLVLHGDKDFVQQEEVDFVINSIGDVQTHRFPDGRHDMHIQYTDEFNRVVDEFISLEIEFCL